MKAIIALSLTVLLFSQPLRAQNEGQLGVNFSVFNVASLSGLFEDTPPPALAPSIGLTYHFSKQFAIRPSFSFVRSSSESSTSGFTSSFSVTQQGISIAGLVYAVSYIRTLNGIIGFQYAFNKRLSVIGETGIGYSNQNRTGSSSALTTIGLLNSGVGVIFYVN
jgi:predicted porin